MGLQPASPGNSPPMLIRRIARPMLAATFISRGVEALRSPKPAADAARHTLEGLSKLPDPVGANVPTNAETVVRVTAAVQIGAGLLLTTGKLPRISSTALALSVVPGSLGAHAFWAETDPSRKAEERRAFLADVGLVGGLIIAAVDTEGRPSLGWRARRAARKAGDAVSGALPSSNSGSALIDSELADRVGHGLNVGAERGRELAHVALERGAELADVAQKRGAEFVDIARDRGPVLAERAQKRGAELVDIARDRAPEIAELAQRRGYELADVARERGTELAGLAQDRGAELAATARKEAKRAKKEVKRARKELKQRTG
jgi:uncharacterized membrane protein YphA (DoxX/SURF4 family)